MKTILIIVVILLVFMFMQSLSARKRNQKQQENLKKSLSPGTWVMTTSGFYGQFVEQDGQVLILQTVDGTETFWDQRAMSKTVEEPPFATPAAQDDERDEDAAGDATEQSGPAAAAELPAGEGGADTQAAAEQEAPQAERHSDSDQPATDTAAADKDAAQGADQDSQQH